METISFIVGSILIGVAVIGGGFEAKEVKIPRVGIGARLLSLGAGLGFIMLALGLNGSPGSHPGDVGDVAASSFNSTTPTDSTVSLEAGDQSSADPTGSNQVQEPATTDTASLPDFGGFSGRTRVTWTADGTNYVGVMETNGPTGNLTVWYSADGEDLQVTEDLNLEHRQDGWWYMGSNPRFVSAVGANQTYTPDFFHVAPNGLGWTFDNACDSEHCMPITVEPLP